MSTNGKMIPTTDRAEESKAAVERSLVAVERSRSETARAVQVAKQMAARLERRTLEAYNTGFEAGFAAAVAAEARQSEARRRTVERDAQGRITAIIG